MSHAGTKDRRVARTDANGIRTTTKPLPLSYEVVLGAVDPDGTAMAPYVRLQLKIDTWESLDGQIRLGTVASTVEAFEDADTPAPVTAEILRSLRLREREIEAIRLHSFNYRGREGVPGLPTVGQARELLRTSERVRSETTTEKYRRVARAHLLAKAERRPAIEAVRRELGGNRETMSDRSVSVTVYRAAKAGILLEVCRELGLDPEKVMTEKQRTAAQREGGSR